MVLDDLIHKINICTRHKMFRRPFNGKYYCILLLNRHEADYCNHAGEFIYVEKREGQCSVKCPYIECKEYDNARRGVHIKQK